MEQKKITATDQKLTNQKNVYTYIYKNRQASKQSIANSLNLSLPTVTQALKILDEKNLVQTKGFFESSGGRKAHLYCVNTHAYVALGIEVLKDHFSMVVINIFGEILESQTEFLLYKHSSDYYEKFQKRILSFIRSLPYKTDEIIGIGIAMQALTSIDGTSVILGSLNDNTLASLYDFNKNIDFPCLIIHEAKAAAFAEHWFQNPQNAIYIGLNHYLGCAIILDDKIYYGDNSKAGGIEHTCIVRNGLKCYCGRNGCMSAYCSGIFLESESKMKLPDFFSVLRQGDNRCKEIWNIFLNYLSFSLDNMRFIFDCKVILGGIISTYMTEEDYATIYSNLQVRELCDIQIIPGKCSHYPAATGAGLYYINKFLENIQDIF